MIKLADVEDNGDPARLALLPEDQRGIGERYRRAASGCMRPRRRSGGAIRGSRWRVPPDLR